MTFPAFRYPNRHRSLAIMCTLLLGACAVPPPMAATPALRSADTLAAASLNGPDGSAWPDETWWRGLGDAQLSALIEQAIGDSPGLAMAAARLHMADGYARSANAALLPSLSANGAAGAIKQSYNQGFPPVFVPHGWNSNGSLQVSAGYDLDLFGRNHAALAAATSDRTAAQIEARAVRLTIATQVAAAYADLGRFAALRDVAAAALDVRAQTAALVTKRVINGLDTRAEQRSAEAAVPVARADLAAADQALHLARNRLAALIGAGPDRAATVTPPAPAQFALIPLPPRLALDLVGRRADIAAARARAEAALARVRGARAAYFPDINLLAFVGAQSLGLANLTATGSETGQAQAAISLPLFAGGRLAGGYAAARGGYDAAVAQYDDTLVQAVRDVADAAAAQTALATELDAAREAVGRSQEAFDLSRRRYTGGLSPYLAVLSAQEALLRNRQLLADCEGRVLAVRVDLIRALGGGFTT
ncbi:efflux transporter outer membrane subunit [Novosphingobium sp.]|uniref:efflux transporter outer membrane subunit n=1 Tax=Novosphingobium sp. TaxID=1874826 RepID=UPI003340AFD1